METQKRSHRGIKIAALVAVAALAAFAILSGTLAKYVTTVDNTAQARVAEFNVSAGDGSGTFGLFDDVQDTDFGVEADVRTADYGDTPIIAPGTWGRYEITVRNDSEVTVIYELTLDVADTPIPLEFSLDGGATWTDDLDNLSTTDILAINTTSGPTDDVEICWRWPYETGSNDAEIAAGDAYDTDLGMADPLDEVLVTATVTFTQQD